MPVDGDPAQPVVVVASHGMKAPQGMDPDRHGTHKRLEDEAVGTSSHNNVPRIRVF